MTDRCINRLQKEYSRLRSDPLPNILAVPDEHNFRFWYYVIYGLTDCPYEGGVYMGVVEIPSDYPNNPPSFRIHTPNGRLVPHQLICLSVSNFHKETWSPTWNIGSTILGLISFMNSDTDGGLGSIYLDKYTDNTNQYRKTCTIEDRRRFAKESLHYNLTNDSYIDKDPHGRKWKDVFIQLFPEFASGNLEESLNIIQKNKELVNNKHSMSVDSTKKINKSENSIKLIPEDEKKELVPQENIVVLAKEKKRKVLKKSK